MPKMLRRMDSDAIVRGRDFNRLMDTALGNDGGRFKLWNDDGIELDLQSGEQVSTGNYPLDVKSDAGNHIRVRHSSDSHDVLRTQDAGLTFQGTLTGTGNTDLTGTLSVSGLVAAAAAMTVGTTLGVTGKLTAGSAEITGLLQAVAAATVGTTLTVGGHASTGSLSVGAAALSGTEELRVIGQTRLEGTTTITTGSLTISSGSLSVNNASSDPLITGTNVQTASSAAAGGASALPATPATYFYVSINGNLRRVPAYL